MKDVSTQDVHYKNNKIALKVLNYIKKLILKVFSTINSNIFVNG